MKNIHLFVGIICLIFHVVICLLFDSIGTHSLIIGGIVILITTGLDHVCTRIELQDAFKISLPFFFSFLGLVQYILAFFVDRAVKNDGFLIVILLLLLLQILVLIISSAVSKFNK